MLVTKCFFRHWVDLHRVSITAWYKNLQNYPHYSMTVIYVFIWCSAKDKIGELYSSIFD